MQVIVNKLLTNYSEVGTGRQTILCLHGWADAGKTFEMLAKQLASDNQYQLLILDLPGFGGSQMPSDAWGLADYSSFVAAFLTKLAIEPEVIIGHSNGGAIAIHGLAGKQLTAKKLILIASAGLRTPSLKKSSLRMMALPAKLVIKTLPKSTQRRVRQKLYSAIGSDYLVAEHMQESFKKIVATDVTEDARKLILPTCLIYGENDAATPVEYGEILAKAITDSELHVIPLTGHFVHQEQVYKVDTIIREFLK